MLRNLVLRSVAVIAGSIVSISICLSAYALDDVPSESGIQKEDVISAWKRRGESVRSARFVWDERVVRHDSVERSNSFRISSPDVASNSGDYDYTVRMSLEFDDERVRYAYDGPIITTSASDPLQDTKRTTAYDGEVCSTIELPMEFRPYPQGTLRDDVGGIAREFTAKPILWAFRMLSDNLVTTKLQSFEVQPDIEEIDGDRCVALQESVKHGASGRNLFYLNIDQGYTVKRYEYVDSNGRILRQLDVSYEEHPVAGWVPKHWKMISQSGDIITSTGVAKLVEFQINPQIPASAFHIEFPPGTLLTDLRDGRDETYFLRSDGTRRRILDSERVTLSYDDILSSEKWVNRRRLFLLVSTLLSISVVAWAYLARRRGKRGETS